MELDNGVKTVCVTEDFLAVFKPHDIPTVPLKNSDSSELTLLGIVSKAFPEVLEVHGKNYWEGSAIHRLDTGTSGLVLFARNKYFYNYMVSLQLSEGFVKVYRANVCGNAFSLPQSVSSYFRAFGVGRKAVKAETDIKKADSKKLYNTDIRIISENTVECTIARGFRHQIRCHLSYLGCPIVGDSVYGGKKNGEDYLHLECISFSFVWKAKTVTVSL